MGQRHVFFHKGDGVFAFATEIKGLWALPDVPRALSEDDAWSARSAFQGYDEDIGATSYVRHPRIPRRLDRRAGRRGPLRLAPLLGAARRSDPRRPRTRPTTCATYRAVVTGGGGLPLAPRRSGPAASSWARASTPAPSARSPAPWWRRKAASSSPPLQSRRRKIPAAIEACRLWVEICRRDMPHLEVRYVTREGLDIFTRMEEGFLATDLWHSPNRYVTDALHDVKPAGARIVMDGFGGDYTINTRPPTALARLLVRGRWRRFFSRVRARSSGGCS